MINMHYQGEYMKQTLTKFIKKYDNGLFLLDSPTGFGKTTAVLSIIKSYLKDSSNLESINQIFFITNLKNNLPFSDLLKDLTDEEKKKCFLLKNYSEALLDAWKCCKIENSEILKTEEYKNLNADIEMYYSLKEDLKARKEKGEPYSVQAKGVRRFLDKIKVDSEPKFRDFLRKKFFFSKSVVEKRKFIDENDWFKKIYPICEIEKYKVIFTTTKKFFMKMNLFYRMPFYVFEDDFLKNSLVFIDEFDSTKKTLLDQIIKDGIKSKVDMIKLFLNIYYSLKNVNIPNNLLKVSEYHKAKQETDGWKTGDELIEENRKLFDEKYKEFHFEYLLKSNNFAYKETFLFYDGKDITIFKDNSKKYLVTYLNMPENNNAIDARNRVVDYKKTVNYLIEQVHYSIDHFIRAVFYLSQNYYYFKNQNSGGNRKFSQEEAIFTILDIFNLQDEFKNFIYDYISQGKLKEGWKSSQRDIEIRKGFKFTEVEDSNYHDLQTQINTFNFDTTPENILIEIADKCRLIGVSATATVNTVIGNYDVKYIEKILKDKYIKIEEEDFARISNDFNKMQNAYKDKVKYNLDIIDDFNMFSYKDKCNEIIKKIFDGDLQKKYIDKIESTESVFYYFSMLKLAYLYKELANKSIYSMIAFLNSFPKQKGDIDLDELKLMFADVDAQGGNDAIFIKVIESKNFDENMDDVKGELSKGKKVFVMTTYQTIGTGKNIQYEIPDIKPINESIIIGENSERKDKDFDSIYLATPTHLTQNLSYQSDNKYEDLAKFLFEQEYLCQNSLIDKSVMRLNIINAFKKVFYSESYYVRYDKDRDLFLHTAQYIIQAVGRICRCRNKNKNINIYTDFEIVDRLNKVKDILEKRLLNEEFRTLLSKDISSRQVRGLEEYSYQNKQIGITIMIDSWTVRNSSANVEKWKDLRDFVLKNPTLNVYKFSKYKNFYFNFENNQSGYSYKKSNHDFSEIKFDYRNELKQVSEFDCDLQLITSVPCVNKVFLDSGFATHFALAKFIMSESLYTQVYKGALGEVAGKAIIESELGLNLKEIQDYSLYELFDYKIEDELFDYKIEDVYIDFKHWNEFYVDREKYIEKIKRKLNRVKGAKAVIINLMQRADHIPSESIDELIVEIPYLIERDTGDISSKMIEIIEKILK